MEITAKVLKESLAYLWNLRTGC